MGRKKWVPFEEKGKHNCIKYPVNLKEFWSSVQFILVRNITCTTVLSIFLHFLSASRIGRQPNTVKRAISLELQKKQDDKSKIPKCSYPAMRKIVGLSCERDIDMPPLYYLENRPSCFEFVSTIDNAAKELVKLNKVPVWSI